MPKDMGMIGFISVLVTLYIVQFLLCLVSTVYVGISIADLSSSYHMPVNIIVLCFSSLIVNCLSLFWLYQSKLEVSTTGYVLHAFQCGILWRAWMYCKCGIGSAEHLAALMLIFSYLHTLPASTIQLAYMLKGGGIFILGFVIAQVIVITLGMFITFKMLELMEFDKNPDAKVTKKITVLSGMMYLETVRDMNKDQISPKMSLKDSKASNNQEAISYAIINIISMCFFLIGRLLSMACLVCLLGLFAGLFVLVHCVCCILYLYYHSLALWPESTEEPDHWGRLILHGYLLVFDWYAKRDRFMGFGLGQELNQVVMYYLAVLVENMFATILWVVIISQNDPAYFLIGAKMSAVGVSYSVVGIGSFLTIASLSSMAFSTLQARNLSISDAWNLILSHSCLGSLFQNGADGDNNICNEKHDNGKFDRDFCLDKSAPLSADQSAAAARRPSSTYIDFKDIDDIIGFPVIHGIQTLGRNIATHLKSGKHDEVGSTNEQNLATRRKRSGNMDSITDANSPNEQQKCAKRKMSLAGGEPGLVDQIGMSFCEARRALASHFLKNIPEVEASKASKDVSPNSVIASKQLNQVPPYLEEAEIKECVSSIPSPDSSVASSPAILCVESTQHYLHPISQKISKKAEQRYYPAKSSLMPAWTMSNNNNNSEGVNNKEVLLSTKQLQETLESSSSYTSTQIETTPVEQCSVLHTGLATAYNTSEAANPRMIQELEFYI